MLDFWRRRSAPFRSLSRNARLYIVAEALSSFATGAFGAVYNLYILSLGVDTALLGTLLVVASVGAGAAVLPAGAVVDRFGPRALLLGGSVVVATGIGMQLTFPAVAVLVVGNALAGAGAATFYVAAAPFLARAAPPERQNDVFSLDTAAALGAAAAGSAVAGQLAAALGAGTLGSSGMAGAYRLALLLGGAVGALSFPVLLLTEEVDRLPTDGRNEPEVRAEAAAQATPVAAPPDEATWRSVLSDGVVRRLGLTSALIGLGAGLFLPFLNVYFVEVLGASPAVYGWIGGAATLTRLGATLLAPAVAARLGTTGAIAATQLASVPFLLLLGIVPSLGLAVPATLVRGALMNMAAPLQGSFTMSVLRRRMRGSGNAVLLLVANVTRGASTLVGGTLIDRLGFRWPVAITALLYTVSSLLFWYWFEAYDANRVSAETTRPLP